MNLQFYIQHKNICTINFKTCWKAFSWSATKCNIVCYSSKVKVWGRTHSVEPLGKGIQNSLRECWIQSLENDLLCWVWYIPVSQSKNLLFIYFNITIRSSSCLYKTLKYITLQIDIRVRADWSFPRKLFLSKSKWFMKTYCWTFCQEDFSSPGFHFCSEWESQSRIFHTKSDSTRTWI